jgi:hypothetical protein
MTSDNGSSRAFKPLPSVQAEPCVARAFRRPGRYRFPPCPANIHSWGSRVVARTDQDVAPIEASRECGVRARFSRDLTITKLGVGVLGGAPCCGRNRLDERAPTRSPSLALYHIATEQACDQPVLKLWNESRTNRARIADSIPVRIRSRLPLVARRADTPKSCKAAKRETTAFRRIR